VQPTKTFLLRYTRGLRPTNWLGASIQCPSREILITQDLPAGV